MDYDADGDFVRLWVEELRGLEGAAVHAPWTLSSGELRRAGVELGVTYPRPMVVAPEWSRHSGGAGGKKPNPKGQRGVDFYFKSDRAGASGGGGGSSGSAKKPPRKGKRLQ